MKLDEFDFFNDDFSDLKSKFNLNFDIALFFGSSYVMDDDEFIKLFNDLKKNNVKYIVDFHAGYMNLDDMIKFKLEPIIKNTYIRKLFNKKPIAFKGKFHGYSRNHSELIKLYKKSGLKIVNEINDESYKYIAILS